jgi:hypothetical protein
VVFPFPLFLFIFIGLVAQMSFVAIETVSLEKLGELFSDLNDWFGEGGWNCICIHQILSNTAFLYLYWDGRIVGADRAEPEENNLKQLIRKESDVAVFNVVCV